MNPSYLMTRRFFIHQSSMMWTFLITLHMGMDFLFLEAGALSNPVETDSLGFVMFDAYLTYFDADESNITWRPPSGLQ